MRRLLKGAKKALRKDKDKDKAQEDEIAQAQQFMLEEIMAELAISEQLQAQRELQAQTASSNQQLTLDLTIPAPTSTGFPCWDNTQCLLCRQFLDPWFILDMFTSKFVSLGNIVDFLQWGQGQGPEGGRCSLCIYVSARFLEETGGDLVVQASVIVRWNTRDSAVKDGRVDEIGSWEFELVWNGTEGRKSRTVNLNCFTEDDQEMGRHITTRPVNPDVNSPAAFETAKGWLSACVEEHTQCNRRNPGPFEMPTRVLEVIKGAGDDGEYHVRLHKSAGQIASYAALSYIWGKPQTCRTLKGNIDKHLTHIDAKEIPKTIMDAVHCTHQLGLKYLWVDSLCIIQDSQEDKAQEIGRMSGIYKNAYVTISASKATSCDEGFLEPRMMPDDLMRSSFKIEMLTPRDPVALCEWIDRYRTKKDFSNYMQPSQIEKAFETSIWNQPEAWYDTTSMIWLAVRPIGAEESSDLLEAPKMEKEPITKRGWTLQESWLSPRMLHYGSGQVIWKCSSGIQVDGGLSGQNSDRDIRTSYELDENGEMVNDDGTKVSDWSKDWINRRTWEAVILEASRRELTSPGDKLNAVDGIVQELRRKRSDEYLAGVWRAHLINQLSWYQDATNRGSGSLLWNRERTSPSWSWIKTDGPVSFSYAENTSVEIVSAVVTRNETVGEWPDSRLIVEGSIVLRAPMCTLRIEDTLPTFKFPTPGSSKIAFTNHLFLDGAFTNPEFIAESSEGELQMLGRADTRFMELSWGKRNGSQNVADESRGLVLVPVEGREGVYRRAGYFVVALEEDIDEIESGTNLIFKMSFEPGNVRETQFGALWKRSLEMEEITIV